MLRDAGIEVEVGVMEEECKNIILFSLSILQTIPLLLLWKSAITLDGKIASYTGDATMGI